MIKPLLVSNFSYRSTSKNSNQELSPAKLGIIPPLRSVPHVGPRNRSVVRWIGLKDRRPGLIDIKSHIDLSPRFLQRENFVVKKSRNAPEMQHHPKNSSRMNSR